MTDAQAPPRPPVRPAVQRTVLTGVVTSSGRDKTIRVDVSRLVPHRKYGKYLRRRTRLHAHDPNNEARDGDVVEVTPCRPISKTKSWRLVRIVRRAPGGAAAGVGEA